MTQRKIPLRCGKLTKYGMGIVNIDIELGCSIEEIARKLKIHRGYIDDFLAR